MPQKRIKLSLIGRPNVGKSTLVNRLAGRRVCIVGEKAGITRDRKDIEFNWDDTPFVITDTGGLTFDREDHFADEIYKQAMAGLEQSDVLIFLVDASSGITHEDAQIAEILRKNIPMDKVYLAVNKVDSAERQSLAYEFYGLGFEKLFSISALHGSQGLSDMLSDIVDVYASGLKFQEDEDDGIIRVAFVGKPNVGKSSLFNKVVGEDRSIVSNISGTTRDAVDMRLKRHDHTFELVDTAGLRRRTKVKESIERYSNIRTTHAIAACDVAILIIDATADDETITDQDQKIAHLVESKGKACVVAINKWDAFNPKVKNNPIELEKFKKRLEYQLRFLKYAPYEFISALKGTRTDKIWELAIEANKQHKRRIETSLLNKMIADIVTLSPPPIVKQKSLRLKYVTQVATAPPEFIFFCNFPEYVPETYKRFLERQLREYFGFEGTPLILKFKKQASKEV